LKRHITVMQQFDLIIVGGGLAGASLAIALRDTPMRIALIEYQAPTRPEGWDARVYAISPANAAFPQADRRLEASRCERISPIHGMDVRGDAGGRLAFSAYEAGVPELGWILESSLMACEFWESAKRQSNLTLFCPSRPKSLDFAADGARLELIDGSILVGPSRGRRRWSRFLGTPDGGSSRGQYPLRREGRGRQPRDRKGRIAIQRVNGSATMAYSPICRSPGTASRSSGQLR
jgi:hypothetical protein